MRIWRAELKEHSDIVSRVDTLDAESAIQSVRMMSQLKDDSQRISLRTYNYDKVTSLRGDINTPKKLICPNCGEHLKLAERCPNCGQLFEKF